MADMISFSTAFLGAVAEFLATPPVFYLFALICLCFVVKAMKIKRGEE